MTNHVPFADAAGRLRLDGGLDERDDLGGGNEFGPKPVHRRAKGIELLPQCRYGLESRLERQQLAGRDRPGHNPAHDAFQVGHTGKYRRHFSADDTVSKETVHGI